MCIECATPAPKNYPVFFTTCEKCEQLTDHRLRRQETLLMCETCDNMLTEEATEKALTTILANRIKVSQTR